MIAPPEGLRPMSDFDPAEPAVLHDRVSGKMIPWTGERRAEFTRDAQCGPDGVILFDGMQLDGWGHPLGG